jgi:hypothetical protein
MGQLTETKSFSLFSVICCLQFNLQPQFVELCVRLLWVSGSFTSKWCKIVVSENAFNAWLDELGTLLRAVNSSELISWVGLVIHLNSEILEEADIDARETLAS